MSSWDGKTRGGLTGYRIFVFILKKLGLKPAYFLLYFVASYYFLFSWKTNREIRHYFRHVHAFGKIRSRLSVYKNYYMLGQILIDKVVVMAGFGKRFTFFMDGEEHLHAMKNGGLLISAHIGSWEIAGHYMQRVDNPFNIVMYDEEHEKIKDYLEQTLTEKQIKIIPIKDDLSHILAIKKALENNELIAIHADRFMEGSKTIAHDFFGKPALFPEGPFYLAARFKAPVSFVFAVKETSSHYHFFATPAKSYETGPVRSIKDTELLPIIKDYICELERMCKAYPFQWFNYHKFWLSEDDDNK